MSRNSNIPGFCCSPLLHTSSQPPYPALYHHHHTSPSMIFPFLKLCLCCEEWGSQKTKTNDAESLTDVGKATLMILLSTPESKRALKLSSPRDIQRQRNAHEERKSKIRSKRRDARNPNARVKT
nr:hypothetical protein CFP56_36339 [Quercus suber]